MGQHTLLHGEALLVIASTDAHHVALGEVRAKFFKNNLKVRNLRSSSTSISF
uniref:Uncharacterized protein n=1 Tax=Oncorhynchus tshawytscha TaxID=74940 RepID=A0A8C8GH41_ONCTS